MNELISDIKKQCYLSINDRDENEDCLYDMEKFVKMIVNECINAIEDYDIIMHNGTTLEEAVHALCTIRCSIKEKFGGN